MDDTQRLLALEEIRVLKADYFLHTDTKNWSALKTLFAPAAETDFRTEVDPPDERLLTHDPDAFVDNTARLFAGVTTMHFGHMPRIIFTDNDNAQGIWSMEDWLWVPEGSNLPFTGTMHGWGHYHERYRRIGGRWLFDAMRLTRTHTTLL